MPKIYPSVSIVTDAFDALHRSLVELELGWTDELERSGMLRVAADVRHHMCVAIGDFDELAVFATMSEAERDRAHEAYLSVLGLAHFVATARIDRLATQTALDSTDTAATCVLDALGPYVSDPDRRLRRALSEHRSLETVLSSIPPSRSCMQDR